ncbi:MAG: exopolyphosphatase [Sphingobacteriaceae bacterium]|nr:exopolyphosphatase [Sphingobacteriaceae bacterium]
MPKRIAALDLGTNTFHLLIADVSGNNIEQIVHSEQKHVKLGEGGINKGAITESAYLRGLKALSDFQQSINYFSVEQIRAVGTAALRTAENGQAFIDEIKASTGIRIEIIDGATEAALIYKGVAQAVDLGGSSLIMDIGGGSVEFIFANSDGITWKKSYPIGAAKLMEMFHNSDPISENDVKAIHLNLDAVLADLKLRSQQYKPSVLIGSAGAFETFATLCQIQGNRQKFSVERSYKFNIDELESAMAYILSSIHSEREENKAILPVRTDMIVVATVLTQYILKELKIESVELSAFALKEGLLLDNSKSW